MKYNIINFKSLPSTNKELKKSKYIDEGKVIIVETQTQGKGRFTRKWSSEKGGIYLSILLKPKKLDNPGILTFAASLSALNAIKSTTKIKLNTKWPNDLYYKNKKLCGILTESILGKENKIIVGIGINSNNKTPKNAISLKKILRKKIDNQKIIKKLLFNFADYYKKYYSKNKHKKIIDEFKKNCFIINKNIKIKTKNKIIQGEAIDINKSCSLIIKKNNKRIKFSEGDILF